VWQIDRSSEPFFGRYYLLWNERNSRQYQGLAGSAPGRMEAGPFTLLPPLPHSPQWDGPDDEDSWSDSDSDSDSDSASDRDNHNNHRRQQRAIHAAVMLLNTVPTTRALSPAGSQNSGYGIASRQVRTSQHVPRDDPVRQMSTTSSASGEPHNIIYKGRAFRLRRALSAPLQGVLDYAYTGDMPGKETPVKEMPVKETSLPIPFQESIGSSRAKLQSRHSVDTEPFPAYYDYLQPADLPSSPSGSDTVPYPSLSEEPKVQFEAQKARPKNSSQDMTTDNLPKFERVSTTTTSAKRPLSGTTLALAPFQSPSSPIASSTVPSPAYHLITADDSSLRHAAIDGPSPSTTYSSVRAASDIAGSHPLAAAGTTRPGGKNEDVSPWVQNLLGSGGDASSPKEEEEGSIKRRPRRRPSRLAGFFRRLFRRNSSTRRPSGGLKRLWRRIRHQKVKAEPTSKPGPTRKPATGGAKPPRPRAAAGKRNRPTQARATVRMKRQTKPTKPTRPSPAVRKERWGLARRKETKEKRAAPGQEQRQHEHRTAREVTYDILAPRADEKALRAREAAPLLGAANTVFMAAS
jgi:hypothetical protein